MVVWYGFGGQCDDWQVLQVVLCVDFVYCSKVIFFWYYDVYQYQVDFVFGQLIYCFLVIVCDFQCDVEGFEYVGQCEDVVYVVFGQQYCLIVEYGVVMVGFVQQVLLVGWQVGFYVVQEQGYFVQQVFG